MVSWVGLTHRTIAIQADGRIVAAGVIYTSVIDPGSAIIERRLADGTLDTTFNGSGTIITPIGADGGIALGIAIQPDGKIVVAGCGRNGSTYHSAVLRYHSNGTPDTSFNGTGSIIIPNSWAASVAIVPKGKIVVVGSVGGQFAILRYNPNGSPDISFGGTGTVVTSFDGYSGGGAHDLATQSDGKILAKGVIGNEVENYSYLIRYDQNGAVDTSFGSDGVVVEPYNVNITLEGDVTIQSDGRIVTVGQITKSSGVFVNDFGVSRYESNGALDMTFNGGLVNTNIWALDIPSAVAIQPDGKIVVAGSTSDTIDHNGALARYQGDLPTVFVSGRVRGPSGAGLRNATVSITGPLGLSQTVRTSTFGFYSLDNIPTGGPYTIAVASRRYRFLPRTLTISDDLTAIDFNGEE